MDVEAFVESMPFADLLGIEMTEVSDGHAEGRIEMREALSWDAEGTAHGGVTFTLADTVGGAALVSLVEQPVPTIDMCIDYLEAGTGDLTAAADVVRLGEDVGFVEVGVFSEDTHVATRVACTSAGETGSLRYVNSISRYRNTSYDES